MKNTKFFFGLALFLGLATTLWGQTTIQSELQTATFEDLELGENSYWSGEVDGTSTFQSGSFSFVNRYTAAWDSWSDFAYANIKESEYNPAEMKTHQYRSAQGGGAEGSASYGVVYYPGSWDPVLPKMSVLNDENGTLIPGMYVNNGAWLYHIIQNGDPSQEGDNALPFKQGDYFKVTFIGTNKAGETISLDYYLADYRSENPKDHYAIHEWEWIDMSSLGVITQLEVKTEGGRKNQFGEILPSYVFIDNVGAAHKEHYSYTDSLVKSSKKEYPLAKLFPEFTAEASFEMQLEEEADPGVARVKIGDAVLEVEGLEIGETAFVVRASQCGKTRFARVKIKVQSPSSLEERVAVQPIRVYPMPAKEHLTLAVNVNNGECYDVEIVNLAGQKVYALCNQTAAVLEIQTAHLPSGMYVLYVRKQGRLFSEKLLLN